MKRTLLLNDEQRSALFSAMRDIGAYQCDMQKSLAKASATQKADGSIVTDVDKESQRRIAEVLTQIAPGIPMLGEENPHDVNAAIMKSPGPIWVVDPLDGTSSYTEGYNEFGINVALLDAPDSTGNRHASFGAVYFPKKQELFYTTAHGASAMLTVDDHGHFSEPKMLQCNKALNDTQPIRIAIGFTDGIHTHTNAQGIEVTSYNNGLPLFADSGHLLAPSKHTAGYRVARVLKDGYHASIFNKPAAIWDIAALEALIRGAGGCMYSLHANGSVSDTPYFGADASRYHNGTLFANPPYLCMHERMLRELGDIGPVISEGAGRYR